jgi:vacuolar protein sorting-associated protein IST1
MKSSPAARVKVHLKLAVSRLRLLQSKKMSLNQQLRRDIAECLRQNRIQNARARVSYYTCSPTDLLSE